MKVVVVGGSGRIGAQVVSGLRTSGHEVVSASPSSGVNTLTGEGVEDAFGNADVIVDASNPPSLDEEVAMKFFETSSKTIIAASRSTGVKHIVVLSIVGTERLLSMGYFKAKLRQEELNKASDVPYTIVRATQFYDFVGTIAESGAQGTSIRLPPVLMQPISPQDMTQFMMDVAIGKPANGTIEVAGPETIKMTEFVARYLDFIGDSRKVIADPQSPYFSARVEATSLMPDLESATLARTTYAKWLEANR